MSTGPPVRAGLRTAATSDLTAGEAGRIRALLDEAFAGEFDEDDWSHAVGGVHVLATVDGELAAHASVVARQLVTGERALRTGYVEAVATRLQWRRRGLGDRVMGTAERLVTGGFELGALAPTEEGAALYLRRGWVPWRGTLGVRRPEGTVPTPDEQVFVLTTPSTPAPLDLDRPLVCDWRPGDLW